MPKPPKYINESPQWMINWFGEDSDFHFLSNFYVGETIYYDGDEYMTAEHLFQALKAVTERDEAKIRNAESPGAAKRLGRRIQLRSDWEQVKFDVMAMVLRVKFARGRDEAELLLLTEDALLMEGNVWGDTTWGVDLKKLDWPGRNWLGTLLMARRAELRVDTATPIPNLGMYAYDRHLCSAAWQFQMESFDKLMED